MKGLNMPFYRISVWVILTFVDVCCKRLSPVILVPGDGGSRMEAKLNKTGTDVYCDRVTKDYYVLWVNLASVSHPIPTRCFIENFRLIYDNKTHKTSPPEGVKIRVPNFGDTDAVEWLSNTQLPKVRYYEKLVKNMVKWGYIRNQTVRGAPYDFRRSPNELGDFYRNLTDLIEDTYLMNNNTRVVLLAHSLGNLVTLYFLNQQSQAWKDKYIESFITLAAPWGGTVKSLRMIASGDNIEIITIKSSQARPMQRSMTSSYFLMPSDRFWNNTEVLVQTPYRNYTVDDYKQFFTDLNFTDGFMMRADTEGLVDPLRPPNVKVHCLYGTGLRTVEKWVYEKGAWPDDQPKKKVIEDGDKTVNIRSLRGCLLWRKRQKQAIYPMEFRGIDHTEILLHPVIINYIKQILFP